MLSINHSIWTVFIASAGFEISNANTLKASHPVFSTNLPYRLNNGVRIIILLCALVCVACGCVCVEAVSLCRFVCVLSPKSMFCNILKIFMNFKLNFTCLLYSKIWFGAVYGALCHLNNRQNQKVSKLNKKISKT